MTDENALSLWPDSFGVPSHCTGGTSADRLCMSANMQSTVGIAYKSAKTHKLLGAYVMHLKVEHTNNWHCYVFTGHTESDLNLR